MGVPNANTCTNFDVKSGLSILNTIELQWLEQLWNLRQGKFELMSVNQSTRSGGVIAISFRFSLKVGSWSFECIIIFAILFSRLLESTFYKEIGKFQRKLQIYNF